MASRSRRLSAKLYMCMTDGGTVAVGAAAIVALAIGRSSGSSAVQSLGFALVGLFVGGVPLLMVVVARSYVRLVSGLRRGSRLLTAAAAGAESAAAEQASAASSQASAIAESSATVEQLAATAASLAQASAGIASAATETAETMTTMQETSEAIAERSLALGTSSQHITDMLALIREISEQTNLLALNAAIEAARAGAAGKGFAVVAGEIRKLAARSLQSSEQIEEIVATIRSETNATILATENGTHQVQEVAGLMSRTLSLIDEATAAAEQQRTAASQVAAAIAQISAAASQVASDRVGRAETTRALVAESDKLVSILSVLGAGPNDTGDVVARFVRRHVRESGGPMALLALTAGLVGAVSPTGWTLAPCLLPGVAGVVGVGWIRFKRASRLLVFGNRVRATVAQVAPVPAELERSTAEGGAAAAEQAAAIGEAAATVEELATTARAIAESSRGVADAAAETKQTMALLRQTVDGIADRSRQLGESSRRIREILTLIGDVSEQTNLLALNAAIEAARAGAAGKGFAVVAEEVRKLAERSVESSDSIRSVVEEILAGADATIAATDEGRRRVGEVAELMEHTAQTLEAALAEAEQQQQAAEQVAHAIGAIRVGADRLAQDDGVDVTAPIVGAVEALQDALGSVLTQGSEPSAPRPSIAAAPAPQPA